jgi:hypothetical protein
MHRGVASPPSSRLGDIEGAQVCGQLTPLLGLAACWFQDGAAGIGNPPRLLRDGRTVTAGQTWDTGHAGLPPGWPTSAEPAGQSGPAPAGPCRNRALRQSRATRHPGRLGVPLAWPFRRPGS